MNNRFIVLMILLGMIVPMPMFAQDSTTAMLEKKIKQFKKIVKCALTQEGCSVEESMRLRAIAGSIIVILATVGVGLGIRKYRMGRKPAVQGITVEAPAIGSVFNPTRGFEGMEPQGIQAIQLTSKQKFSLEDQFQKGLVSHQPMTRLEMLGAIEQGLEVNDVKAHQLLNAYNTGNNDFKTRFINLVRENRIKYKDDRAKNTISDFIYPRTQE